MVMEAVAIKVKTLDAKLAKEREEAEARRKFKRDREALKQHQ